MGSDQRRITLFQWVWRAYIKASLVPLLVLEIALISVYFLSNQFSNKENIRTIHDVAEHELAHLAAREANGINHQLDSIANATSYLQKYSATVMSAKKATIKDDPSRFAYSPAGAFYTLKDIGGSALFYSGFIPVGKAEREKAFKSAALDPALIGIKNAFPLVAQTYINTHDSLNRIYPYFDVVKQYPAQMNIPSYNFYYEADAKNNPKRGTVWTDVYIDPAGQGWMTSCIAPVYNQEHTDFLEGVVGIDITIKNIVDAVKALQIPWQGYGVLISRSGTILALPQQAERDWGVNGLTKTNYSTAIKQDTFRADDYNVYLKPIVATTMKNSPQGFQRVTLSSESLLAWATIPATGWKIMIVAPENQILKPANALAGRLNQIALFMLIGMLVFYSIFIAVLYLRTQKLSLSISEPLKNIDAMVFDIAVGHPISVDYEFVVSELNSTASGILDMGKQLELAKQARAKASEELRKKSEQLQTIFDVSPSGYVLVNDKGEVVLSNKAFSHLLGISQKEAAGMEERDFWQRLCSQAKGSPYLSPDNMIQRIDLIRPRPTSLLCGMRKIYQNDNAVFGKLYFFHDITKEEEINHIKNDFLAHATHELRTPLTSILGYAELLLDNRIETQMQQDIFLMVHHQAAHLVKMINELLDLAKIAERSGGDFTILPYSLNHMLEEAIREFVIPEEREMILFSRPQFDVTVNVDKARFLQVLLNIFDNAYKFSTSDGGVFLSVVNSNDKKTVAVEIIDQGIGLSDDELKRVFDRFYRVDKSGSSPGNGLGLSVAKEIMMLLNGSIAISSSLNNGTRVTITMPAIQQKTTVINPVI